LEMIGENANDLVCAINSGRSTLVGHLINKFRTEMGIAIDGDTLINRKHSILELIALTGSRPLFEWAIHNGLTCADSERNEIAEGIVTSSSKSLRRILLLAIEQCEVRRLSALIYQTRAWYFLYIPCLCCSVLGAIFAFRSIGICHDRHQSVLMSVVAALCVVLTILLLRIPCSQSEGLRAINLATSNELQRLVLDIESGHVTTDNARAVDQKVRNSVVNVLSTWYKHTLIWPCSTDAQH
jgi:hypothetical protein